MFETGYLFMPGSLYHTSVRNTSRWLRRLQQAGKAGRAGKWQTPPSLILFFVSWIYEKAELKKLKRGVGRPQRRVGTSLPKRLVLCREKWNRPGGQDPASAGMDKALHQKLRDPMLNSRGPAQQHLHPGHRCKHAAQHCHAGPPVLVVLVRFVWCGWFGFVLFVGGLPWFIWMVWSTVSVALVCCWFEG